MKLIKNFEELAINERRRTALTILEAGLEAIQPKKLVQESISREGDWLLVGGKRINLQKPERVILIGFGKGSAAVAGELEKILGNRLDEGWVIDTVKTEFKKINFTLGTHPLPSKINLDFTEKVLEKTTNLTTKDLVLVIICGGGSALFESPRNLSFEDLRSVFEKLLYSGATIEEMNVVRKHLSKVKGGNLAKHLYPAKVVSLIFSDVPGNDLSVIASGTTVRAGSTVRRAEKIIEKYKLPKNLIPAGSLVELPKEPEYFDKVQNLLILSNQMALEAMKEKARDLGFKAFIFSDKFQGEAKKLGKKLIDQTPPGKILLAGGESTIKVTGKGKGGRNQSLVLASLPTDEKTLILAFDSDGIDYYHFGGAIGDSETWIKTQKLKLTSKDFLDDDNSYAFFEKTGDGIYTDKLGSNVADLIIVCKI